MLDERVGAAVELILFSLVAGHCGQGHDDEAEGRGILDDRAGISELSIVCFLIAGHRSWGQDDEMG